MRNNWKYNDKVKNNQIILLYTPNKKHVNSQLEKCKTLNIQKAKGFDFLTKAEIFHSTRIDKPGIPANSIIKRQTLLW